MKGTERNGKGRRARAGSKRAKEKEDIIIYELVSPQLVTVNKLGIS